MSARASLILSVLNFSMNSFITSKKLPSKLLLIPIRQWRREPCDVQFWQTATMVPALRPLVVSCLVQCKPPFQYAQVWETSKVSQVCVYCHLTLSTNWHIKQCCPDIAYLPRIIAWNARLPVMKKPTWIVAGSWILIGNGIHEHSNGSSSFK